MKKHRFFAFVLAFSILFASLLCTLTATAEISFDKPITTSTVTPTDVSLADFSAASLVDLTGNAQLYYKGNTESKIPAVGGITTLMTAYLAAITLSYDTDITCGTELNEHDFSSAIGLNEGLLLTANDLLAAVLFEGADDAAAVLASYISKTNGKDYVSFMNETAAELGMTSTYYSNPYGDYDPAACTSVRDIAILSAAVYSQPTVLNILSSSSYRLESMDGNFSSTLRPSISVISEDGTCDAGMAVTLTAEHNDRTLILVLASDEKYPEYDEAAQGMFTFGYEDFVLVDFTDLAESLLEKSTVTVSDILVSGFSIPEGSNATMSATVAESLSDTIKNNPSAFSLTPVSAETEGDIVTAMFSFKYLNNNEIATFEATAEAPESLKKLNATPTPHSTNTGYENTHNTPSPNSDPTTENEPYSFVWIVYIIVAVAVGLGIILAAETLKKRMH